MLLVEKERASKPLTPFTSINCWITVLRSGQFILPLCCTWLYEVASTGAAAVACIDKLKTAWSVRPQVNVSFVISTCKNSAHTDKAE